MYSIAIIGAGNLGRRHMQALAASWHDLQIQVVDPFESSIAAAKTIWEETNKESFQGDISFHTSIGELKPRIDVAIVATDASVRKQVIKDLLEKTKLRFLVLEKFLFQSLADYSEVESLLAEKNVKAWVNCPRRMFPIYQQLKSKLAGESEFSMQVSGSQWGLACNAIHFFDLFHFLSEQGTLQLSGDLLDKEIHDTKRAGFIEFSGTLAGVDAKGNSLQLTSYKHAGRVININITTPRYNIFIEEAGAKSYALVTDKTNPAKPEYIPFAILFQSQLSGVLVDELLDSATSSLCDYAMSSQLHTQLLKIYLQHYSQLQHKEMELCPIT